MFDVVILGGGSGGYSCALRSAQLGLSVALIEQDKLGGTCLHRGCIPTKALLHAAELADNAREASKLGVHAQLNGIELPKVNEYRDGVVGRLYKGLQGLIKQDKIRYIEGTGLPHSRTAGVHWLERAANNNHVAAQSLMAAHRLAPGDVRGISVTISPLKKRRMTSSASAMRSRCTAGSMPSMSASVASRPGPGAKPARSPSSRPRRATG